MIHRSGAALAPLAALTLGVAARADIQVVGATVVPVPDIVAAARLALGGAAPEGDALRKAADAVRALYRSRGYSLAQVTGAEVDAAGSLKLTIAEGKIRRILVVGARRTRTATVRAALYLQPGVVYRDQTAREDRDRLARLGIFDDVLLTARTPEETAERDGKPAPDEEIGLVDVVVRIKEAQTGNVAATVGYGDVTGLVGFVSLSENNAFGRAERVRLEWQRWSNLVFFDDGTVGQDTPRQAFNVTYGRPALGPQGIAYDVSVYDQNTIFLPTFSTNVETLRNYERRRGASVRVGRRLAGIWSGFVTARHDDVGFDPVPPELDPPQDELARATARVAALGLQLQADGRDRIDSPRNGFLYQLSHERAGSAFGGDRNFSLSQADLRRYMPLPLPAKRDASLAGRILVGWSSGEVPLSEQYYLGGFDLLRGYDIYSIRGDRMALASAEARFPLGPGLAGALFVDYGRAWVPGESASLRGFKTGIGAGFRFASPIGPIRFDVAHGNRVQTYVSLGQAF